MPSLRGSRRLFLAASVPPRLRSEGKIIADWEMMLRISVSESISPVIRSNSPSLASFRGPHRSRYASPSRYHLTTCRGLAVLPSRASAGLGARSGAGCGFLPKSLPREILIAVRFWPVLSLVQDEAAT